jgi:hypothetical protein
LGATDGWAAGGRLAFCPRVDERRLALLGVLPSEDGGDVLARAFLRGAD